MKEADNNPFGVLAFLNWDYSWCHFKYTKNNLPIAFDRLKELGCGWVRMDFLWYDIEPRQGVYDFSKYDYLVGELKSRGINILGILEYNPLWRGSAWNDPPDQELYLKYCKAVAEHFKGQVKYWEIWNEPDSPEYWSKQDDLKTYGRLLAAASKAIKDVDPLAKIVMGGLSGSYYVNLRRLYQSAGKDSFDVVNIHPFIQPDNKSYKEMLAGICRSLKSLMLENNDADKPIWITEIGCPGVNGKENVTWWQGRAQNEKEQSEFLKEAMATLLKAEGVKKIFWAFFQDTDEHFNSGVDYFGLVRQDFSVKPAFKAYQETVKNWKESK